MKRNKLGNRGFSLVELLVVIGILATCAALIGLSISSIGSARVRKCASECDALLSRCKVSAMAKEAPVYLRLYLDDEGDVRAQLFERGESVLDERLGPSSVSFSVTVNGATTKLAAGQSIYLSFRRDTGAFLKLSEVGVNTTFNSAHYCTELVFSGGKTRTINLTPATGHHEIA